MIPMRRGLALAGVLAGLLALAGCKPEAKPPPVRPVLSVVVSPHTVRTLGFAGTIEPRYQTNLGFRVLGRIVARHAQVGDIVTKGTLLAALDPVALELSLRSAQADLASALAQASNAAASEVRQRTLLEQNAASQAQYDLAQQARDSAAAAVERARANLAKTQEQAGYAELRSDFDGVVTAVDAEVGQVVSPGQSVMTVARPDAREAVIDLPEDTNGDVKAGAPFDVALQTDPTVRALGKVREIAPQADPVTRTRRVRIALDDPPVNFRLGSTVTATLTTPVTQRLELPASAVLERDGKTMVWVVDPGSRTVATRDVTIAGRFGSMVQIADGLSPGTRVVTAGVNSLTPGQSVRLAEASR